MSPTLPMTIIQKFATLGWVLPMVMATLALARPPIAEIEQPRVMLPGWTLELVAREPEIVTPVAVAFDQLGRLLVIESHTHFRPDGYEGPQFDRIRALADSTGDGRLDRWSTFYEASTATMGLASGSDNSIFVAQRDEVFRLRDIDGDGVAEERLSIAKLHTTELYPHNGLGGLAYDRQTQSLYLGLGENLGTPYTLTSRDGAELQGGGSGSVYRCKADGSGLERIASGMWNPFSLCVLQGSHVFAVDNDPDASPPCRLLHIVPGGDYGFRFRFGRSGRHPLQTWDGKLPGTLPMVCGTGEAPSAIVPYQGHLWVTSWGDHTIERYELLPRGASFGAKKSIVVQGGTDFRPVGMAVAPDGSIYFSDWVKRDYQVHGHGRIWRFVPPKSDSFSKTDKAKPWPVFNRPNQVDYNLNGPFTAAHEAWRMATEDGPISPHQLIEEPAQARRALMAHRLRNQPVNREQISHALSHDDPAIRFLAVRWIADEHLTEYRSDVAKLLEREVPDERYYLAVLGAIDWLSRKPEARSSTIADGLLARELRNSKRSPERHAMALRLLSPDHKQLTPEVMQDFMRSPSPSLRQAAVQTLALQSNAERFSILLQIATDEAEDANLRADAIAGLAVVAADNRELLEKLAADNDSTVSREAKRTLRLVGLAPVPEEEKPSPDNIGAWLARLGDKSGDAAAGRRLFFSTAGARCGICHQYSGRGGTVGPELTNIGQHRNRTQLIRSILQPSAEVAPRYVPWILETTEGQVHTGLKVPRPSDEGQELYHNSQGEQFLILSENVEVRTPSKSSIMPSGLQELVTLQDLRDLLALLTQDSE